MQNTNTTSTRNAHRRVASSATLNRRYVRRPAGAELAPSMVANNAETINGSRSETGAVKVRMQSKIAQSRQASRQSAVELKDQAIRRALADANKLPKSKNEQPRMLSTVLRTKDADSSMDEAPMVSTKKARFGVGRVLIALGCAVVAVFGIVYFVNTAMPDVSIKVAAMQVGIDNPYPSYVPRGYSITDASSESGKMVLSFRNSSEDSTFTITEERSSWDSNALLNNFVKDEYDDNYDVIREQGLTLYVSGSNATWVNGGVVYKISAESGTLTKKQLRSIAVSL